MGFKIDAIKKILFDTDRKSLWQIYRDIKWIKNQSPFWAKSTGYYFVCLMYKKDAGRLEDYLPDGVWKAFIYNSPYYKHTRLHPDYKGHHPILNDKKKFKELTIEKGIDAPTYLGSIKDGVLTLAGSKSEINLNDESAVKAILNQWIEKEEAIFIKRVDGMLGMAIYKVDSWESFLEIKFQKKEYLIEGKIKQIKSLDEVNPNCATSLRLVTILKEGEPFILGSYYRTGIGDNYIDHTTSGGVMVPYDIFQNKLTRIGYQGWEFGGKSFTRHPNTGFEFADKPLPYPEKVIALAKRAALAVPDQTFIGWDIAFTEDGPVVMEGNDNPSLLGLQVAFRGLLNNPHFKELFQKYMNPDGTPRKANNN